MERARALVQRFPDHGGAHRLLVDALIRARTRRLRRWLPISGHSAGPTACRPWRRCSNLPWRGHTCLADRLAARGRDLGAVTRDSRFPSGCQAEVLRQPDGSLASLEDMARFEIGKLHLDAHDFAGAACELDGVAMTPARNNRALALFHLGRIEAALTAALDAWQQDPGNLFALGWALQLRLYRGDETGARGLAVPLAQAEARRIEDAHAQTLALLLIWEDQAAWDAFDRSSKAAWVEARPAP